MQKWLKWAEDTMLKDNQICPFEGCTDYLYAKGSMSLQSEKGWHDDGNGPACFTCWQNFGNLDEDIQLIIAIQGCDVRINAGFGKIVHFMAWLPHCTKYTTIGNERRTSNQARLHHTSYTKMKTEWAAYVIREYEDRNLELNTRFCGGNLREIFGRYNA